MRKYHRWLSIAASVVFLVGITDTALLVHTKLTGLFESLIQVSIPGTTELSLEEGRIYTTFLEIPLDGRSQTPAVMQFTMKSKATGSQVSMNPTECCVHWYFWAGHFGLSTMYEFQIPHAGVYELDAQINREDPSATGTYTIGYNWEERWSHIYRLTAIGLSGWLSVAALLAFLAYTKRPVPAVSQPQGTPVETDRLASEDSPVLHRLRFHGTGSELFGIFLQNVLFTLITLGIYSFWAKVRTRKYIWSQTEFGGDRLGFHGTGKELLLGWLKAAILFGGLAGFTSLLPMVWDRPWAVLIGKLLLFFGVLLLVPIARIGAMRYRLSRTSWRGIRFSFVGEYRPFLGLSLRGLLLTALTAGLYYPVYQTRVRGYVVNHSSFGSCRFKFDGDGRELIGGFLRAVLLVLPTLGLIWIWYGAQLRRYYWSHTSFGGARFHCSVTGRELLSLYAGNLLIILLSLGFAFPWATVRTKRYDLDHLILEGAVDLDSITQQAQTAAPTADELAGFLDVAELPG